MNEKIKIKRSAYIILPTIALLISIIGAIICFNEGLMGGNGWNPILWLFTVFAIPVITIIIGIITGIFSLLIDQIFDINFCLSKSWVSILVIAATSPLWTPFTISSGLYYLGTVISEDKVKLEKNQPIEVEPEPIPQPKTPYHCESKVTPDGIQTFCVGNPEDK